jgi:putative ubiquitin-RnfH superfamily antitoxin RatB of RatAB toxin-antitoxin module
MQVEIVFALPERQVLEALDLEDGATVAEAIARSGIERSFPGVVLSELQVGIWGRAVDRGRVLRDGDRVEIYRPLEIDPREARRLKARL